MKILNRSFGLGRRTRFWTASLASPNVLAPLFSPHDLYRESMGRELGKLEESRHEMVEFEKLKKMKSNLQDLYQAMRLQPGKQETPEPSEPK